MVVCAAATGLRPSELFGTEGRDVDRGAGAVYVRPAYADGRLKHTKKRPTPLRGASNTGWISWSPALDTSVTSV